MPVGFHVTDNAPAFRIIYCNRPWEQRLGAQDIPVVGRPLAEVLPAADESGLLRIMGEVCETSQARHLTGFELPVPGVADRSKTGQTSRWDWEIYPLSDVGGRVSHLLNVVLDVTPLPLRGQPVSKEERQAQNRRREEASGVLRIFGVAPETPRPKPREELTEREHEVADLVALGLTNTTIGDWLRLSRATVSSHVASILAKLGFRSRAQIAAWVVEGRLQEAPGAEGQAGETDQSN
jgi:DNA-binding CsgD family transcriptional regulator